jgi:rubredoxin
VSFIVCANGIVYEADLGDDTDGIAGGMAAYDPDERWMPCD